MLDICLYVIFSKIQWLTVSSIIEFALNNKNSNSFCENYYLEKKFSMLWCVSEKTIYVYSKIHSNNPFQISTNFYNLKKK